MKNECEMEREKYICQTPAEVAGHKGRQRDSERGRKREREPHHPSQIKGLKARDTLLCPDY